MPIYELDGVSPNLAGSTTSNENCWVAPCASLIGDIVLEQDASVWFGAVLRGDNEQIRVGEGSNIQELTCMHTDMGFPLTVGKYCTIGHNVILHGCTIGEGTLVGMGSTIMNGAVVGKGCLIGAGALISEGKQIPDGSLVLGAPGRVVKALDQNVVANLKDAARHYIDNSKKFRSGLKQIEA